MVKEGTTTHLKLTNGEEVVAKVLKIENGFLRLFNGMVMSYTITPTMEAKYALQPWFTMIENENEIISLHLSHVVAFTDPNKNLLEEYDEASRHMNQTGKNRMKYYSELKDTHDKLKEKLKEAEKSSSIVPFPTNKDDDTFH